MPAITIRIGAAIEEFEKALGQISRDLDKAGRVMQQWGQQMAVAGAAVTAALGATVAATVRYSNELDRASKISGIAVEQMARLKYAADQEHASLESLSTGLKFLARNMAEATNSGSSQAAMFRALGVSVVDANGTLRSADAVMLDVADRFKVMTSDAERTKVAMELFGRSGVELVPMLKMGSAGIKDLGDEAQRLGLVMSQQAVAAAKQFDDRLTTLKGAVQGAAMQVGMALIPAIERLVVAATNIISTVTAWMQANQPLVETISRIALVVGGLLTVMGTLLLTFGAVTKATALLTSVKMGLLSPIGLLVLKIGAVITIAVLLMRQFDNLKQVVVGLGRVFLGLGTIILGALTFDVDRILAGWDQMKAGAAQSFSGIVDAAKGIARDVTAIWDGVVGFVRAKAPEMPVAVGAATGAMAGSFSTLGTTAKSAMAEVNKQLQAALKAHTDEIVIQNLSASEQIARLREISATYARTAEERRAIAAKIAELERKVAAEKVAANQKALKQSLRFIREELIAKGAAFEETVAAYQRVFERTRAMRAEDLGGEQAKAEVLKQIAADLANFRFTKEKEAQDKIRALRQEVQSEIERLTLSEWEIKRLAIEREFQARMDTLNKTKAFNAQYAADVQAAEQAKNLALQALEAQRVEQARQATQQIAEAFKRNQDQQRQDRLDLFNFEVMTGQKTLEQKIVFLQNELAAAQLTAQQRKALEQDLFQTTQTLTNQKVAEAQRLAQTNKQAAVETLEAWRASLQEQGLLWPVLAQQIDAALLWIRASNKVARDDFRTGWEQALLAIQQKAMTWKDAFVTLFKDIRDAFSIFFQDVLSGTGTFVEHLTKLWNALKSAGIKAIADMLAQWLIDLAITAAKWVKTQLAMAIAGIWASLLKTFGIFAPLFVGLALAAIAWATGLIKLAEGGIVTKPTQVLLGEAGPEAVIPMRRMGEMFDTTPLERRLDRVIALLSQERAPRDLRPIPVLSDVRLERELALRMGLT